MLSDDDDDDDNNDDDDDDDHHHQLKLVEHTFSFNIASGMNL